MSVQKYSSEGEDWSKDAPSLLRIGGPSNLVDALSLSKDRSSMYCVFYLLLCLLQASLTESGRGRVERELLFNAKFWEHDGIIYSVHAMSSFSNIILLEHHLSRTSSFSNIIFLEHHLARSSSCSIISFLRASSFSSHHLSQASSFSNIIFLEHQLLFNAISLDHRLILSLENVHNCSRCRIEPSPFSKLPILTPLR
jgi:hypothetical protein